MIDLAIIILLTILSGILSPLYLLNRVLTQRTAVDEDKPKSFYTVGRVLRLIFLNAFIIACMIALLTILFLAVKAQDGLQIWSVTQLLTLGAFVLGLLTIVYGAGMYTTAIISEEYTLNRLRKGKEYKILDLPTKLIHGPLSHVLMYSGMAFTTYVIALLELSQHPRTEPLYLAYVGMGVGLGLVFASNLIGNNTWLHQIPQLLAILVGFVFVLAMKGVSLSEYPFSSFFLAMCAVVNIAITANYFIYRVKHGTYMYDRYKI